MHAKGVIISALRSRRQLRQKLIVSRKSTVAILAILVSGSIASALSQQTAPSHPFAGFAPRTEIPILKRAHSVVADDVNEDGRIDLIVAVAGADSVALLLGKGDGTFEPPRHRAGSQAGVRSSP